MSDSQPKFRGVEVVIVGSFSKPRKSLEAQFSALGATIATRISTNTDLVVYGRKSGSDPKAARDLGIPAFDSGHIKRLLKRTPKKAMMKSVSKKV